MKPEEMNLLRKRYYDLKGQKEKIMKVKMELLELEKSSEVQRYLELVGEYQEISDEGIADIENKDDDFFLRRAINFSKITPTNDIYVYIGAYKYNYETDVINTTDTSHWVIVVEVNKNVNKVTDDREGIVYN